MRQLALSLMLPAFVLCLTACGGGGGGGDDDENPFAEEMVIASRSFTSNGSASPGSDVINIEFSADDAATPLIAAEVTDGLAGLYPVVDASVAPQAFAELVQALTDGQATRLALRIRNGVGSSARLAEEAQLLDIFVPLDGPDFAGWEITGVQVELARANVTRTGSSVATDLEGELRILGRRTN